MRCFQSLRSAAWAWARARPTPCRRPPSPALPAPQRGRTCHYELRVGALVDLSLGRQGDGPAEVDAAVVAPGLKDTHLEVAPIGQPRDLEAPVAAGLATVLREGGQLVVLVPGAQAVPVEHEVLRRVGEAAGEGGRVSLGHQELRRVEGEGSP